MIFIFLIAIIIIIFMYCAVKIGAEADRQMEEIINEVEGFDK